MAKPSTEVVATIRWWLRPYMYVLIFFCVIMRREPDMEKFSRVVSRGIKLTIK